MDNGGINRGNGYMGENFDANTPVDNSEQVNLSSPENLANMDNPTPEKAETTINDVSQNNPENKVSEIDPNQIMAPGAQAFSTDQTIAEQNPEISVVDDADDKFWIRQTENIIEQNEHNPYKLEEEANRLKKSYVAKKYNRHWGDRND